VLVLLEFIPSGDDRWAGVLILNLNIDSSQDCAAFLAWAMQGNATDHVEEVTRPPRERCGDLPTATDIHRHRHRPSFSHPHITNQQRG